MSYFSFQPVLHDWCNKGRGMFSMVIHYEVVYWKLCYTFYVSKYSFFLNGERDVAPW